MTEQPQPSSPNRPQEPTITIRLASRPLQYTLPLSDVQKVPYFTSHLTFTARAADNSESVQTTTITIDPPCPRYFEPCLQFMSDSEFNMENCGGEDWFGILRNADYLGLEDLVTLCQDK
ncbi:hypothetical protein HDV00_002271 [Rhizophlyctis rosea]|nr:hypothetical protein HDV00_002271 [Rhizophlyctis rosea]